MYAFDLQQQWHPEFPVVTHDDVIWADAVIWGAPTRFGNVPAQMKAFMDSMGGIWRTGACVGKLASCFTSSSSQHGGNETTIVCGFLPFLFHMGFIICGLPYSYEGQTGVDEIKGGTPYGASTITGGDGARMPSDNEKAGAAFQGRHCATIAGKLSHTHTH